MEIFRASYRLRYEIQIIRNVNGTTRPKLEGRSTVLYGVLRIGVWVSPASILNST